MIHPCYGIFYVKKRSACMGIEGSPRYMIKGKKKKKKKKKGTKKNYKNTQKTINQMAIITLTVN